MRRRVRNQEPQDLAPPPRRVRVGLNPFLDDIDKSTEGLPDSVRMEQLEKGVEAYNKRNGTVFDPRIAAHTYLQRKEANIRDNI